MKTILVLVAFTFISLNAQSQQNSSQRLALSVEKQTLDSKKEFIFRPNQMLRIKTKLGGKILL